MIMMKFYSSLNRSLALSFLLLIFFCYACKTNQDTLATFPSIEDHILKGNNYSDTGNYQKAASEYTKAIDENPNNALAYFSRGAVLHLLEQYEDAISDYSKAIEIDSTFILPYHNRSNAYKTLGMYDKADADIIKVQVLTKLLEESRKISSESK